MGEEKKFRLKFHEKVLTQDLPSLKPTVKDALLHFLNEKLAKKPFSYARPLRGNTDGYWKVQIGNYLLGFKIVGDLLLILSIIPYYKLYGQVISAPKKMH